MSGSFLGVDGGGTRTRAMVMSEDGRTSAGEAGPANWTTLGPERCVHAISQATRTALASSGLPVEALTDACVALSGYYPPWHEVEARAGLEAVLPGVNLRLEPDLVAAWAGATGGRAGIVLVAGTGAVAYGRDAEGHAARAGGWGPLFGDEGGGFWVGCEALRAVSRALDGRGPATSLQRVLESEERLRRVYRDGWSREQVASLAEAVACEAEAGDAVAGEILSRAAAELGALITAVHRQLPRGAEALPVSAVGGLAQTGSALRDPLQRWLAAVLPDARWLPPHGEPVEGAVWLAREGGVPCPTQ